MIARARKKMFELFEAASSTSKQNSVEVEEYLVNRLHS